MHPHQNEASDLEQHIPYPFQSLSPGLGAVFGQFFGFVQKEDLEIV